jgi:pyruvate formate lyase activating enzyme
MTSGIVFDIKKFSVHDGPGIRTTVFLKGCGLRCWWCHNPESQQLRQELLLRPNLCIECGECVDHCPQSAIGWNALRYVTDRETCTQCGSCLLACYADAREIIGKKIIVDAVLEAIMRDVAFYDESGGGVTFSGGEPLLQGDFLLGLLRACKEQDLHTTVDTCGYAPTEIVNRIRPYVDLFLCDLKTLDDERHKQVTGASNQLILKNLRLLAENNHSIILRIPVIPGINDSDEELQQIGALAAELGIQQVDLLPYHKIGSDKYERIGRMNPMPETEPPSEERMQEIVAQLHRYGLTVTTGG